MQLVKLFSGVVITVLLSVNISLSATTCQTSTCYYNTLIGANKTQELEYQCGSNTTGKLGDFKCTTQARYMECTVKNPGPEMAICECSNKDFFEKHQANISFGC